MVEESLMNDAQRSTTRRLALAGIVFPPLWLVVLIVLGFVKPGFNQLTQAGSSESIGQYGWVQVANFTVLGVALVVFAFGLWRGFGDRLSGRIGSLLMAIAGVSLVGSGVFVADGGNRAVSFHGNMHMTFSLVLFLSLLIAGFVYARRFWDDRRFAIYSIATALVIPASFLVTFVVPPGLSQRVMLIIVWTWITVLGLRLRRASAAASASSHFGSPAPSLEPGR
jgi:hypothetical membrane protein